MGCELSQLSKRGPKSVCGRKSIDYIPDHNSGDKRASVDQTFEEQKSRIENQPGIEVENAIDERECPTLNDKQRTLIENTWKLLVDNISRVGVITFMRLFETHPEVQEAFMPFRELDRHDLKFSKELRAHALRVMGIVQKVVARIHDTEKIEQLMAELGKKHVVYGAKVDYVDLVGPQFIYAIKPSLESLWNEEVEESWHLLFKLMAFLMKKAMNEKG